MAPDIDLSTPADNTQSIVCENGVWLPSYLAQATTNKSMDLYA